MLNLLFSSTHPAMSNDLILQEDNLSEQKADKAEGYCPEPYSTSKSGLTKGDIQDIAEKISNKLVKLVEKQLQA